MKLGFEGTNQTAEISRLRAKIAEAKTKATYVQDLAIDALSNKHMDIRAAVAVCPSERDGSLKNIQDATEVIFNIRALIATEAKAK